MESLATSQLVLEPITAAHAPAMFELLQEPALYRYLDYGPPPSVGHLREVYERLEVGKSPDGAEHWLNWVVRPPGSAPIGYVQATVVPGHRAWIAYVFSGASRGRGFATQACEAMVAHLAAAYGVTECLATVEAANAPSIALLRRLGFRAADATELKGHRLGATERLYVRGVVRIIRHATLEDAAMLCAAEREVVARFDGMLVSEPDEVLEPNFRERIATVADGRGKYLIAEDRGTPVAHASLWPMGLRKISHVLRLDLCVHVGHWRQGHGEALLRSLLEWATLQSSARKVELLVRAENAAAISLYKKLGFIEEGRMRDRVRLRSGRYVDDISMALFLSPEDGQNTHRPGVRPNGS